MARPRTELGTAGTIKLVGQTQTPDGRWVAVGEGVRATRWRARTKFRDLDGVLRDVERFATTKAKAEAKLKSALADRQAPSAKGVLRAETTVDVAGQMWLEQADRPDSNLSAGSRDQYRAAFNRYVHGSQIAALTLREANRVHVLESWLQRVADEHGTGSAKTARSVVSNIIGRAVRLGVLEFSAMREVRPAKSKLAKDSVRDTTRALDRDERAVFLESIAASERATLTDVADVGWFMAGTGVRISEALGQLWSDIDLEAGTVLIRGTKTESSVRLLTLPEWLLERLTARRERMGTSVLVFPSPGTSDSSKPRDRRNVARVLREEFDAAGFPWATPHSLRRTVATLIDDAGLGVGLASNVLGHKDPSMTARVYLGRKGSTAAAAAVL